MDRLAAMGCGHLNGKSVLPARAQSRNVHDQLAKTTCLSVWPPLIYAKNGHRPQLLEHLAEVFPRHVQIHYGQYQREQLFEAARRSRACAYLADDDHGPLALQEILLAGCPTVGVRTGASFVKTGETGVLVDRLPPGRQCAESDDDVRALAVFIEAIEHAQSLDRHSVRERAAQEFDTGRISHSIIPAVNKARLGGGIETAASV